MAARIRIILGTLMIVMLAAVLWLDWHLERNELLPVRALPLAAAFGPVWIWAFAELRRLARAGGLDLLIVSGLVGLGALSALPFWVQLLPQEVSELPLALLVLWLGMVLAFVEQMASRRIEGGFGRVAGTLGAIVYLGGTGAIILSIRMDHGIGALVLFLAAVKCTDIGAYFVGSSIGRHKLIPWLSPGKSWEGLIGGVLVGTAASVLAANLLMPLMSVFHAAIFGVTVGLAGQFGDLCESLLKRSAKLKDSGSFLPHFGGVLDVIDSVLIAAPVALICLTVLL